MRSHPLPLVIIAAVVLSCAVTFCSKKRGTNPDDDGDERIQWTYQTTPGIYYGSPALDPGERTVYFGTSLPFFSPAVASHRFVALDAATGALRWSVELGGEVRSTPAIAPDSSIYFMMQGNGLAGIPADGDELCHLAADGAFRWKRNINPSRVPMDVGQSAPAIGPDGTVYVAGD